MCIFVCLYASLCMSVSVRLSVDLSVRLCVCWSVCLFVCLLVCLSVGLSVGLAVCRSVDLSVCLFVLLAVCPSVCHCSSVSRLSLHCLYVMWWLVCWWMQAQRRHPDFATTYENTLQKISINFSALELLLHQEAILSIMEFGQSIQSRMEKPKEEGATLSRAISRTSLASVSSAMKKLEPRKGTRVIRCPLRIFALLNYIFW